MSDVSHLLKKNPKASMGQIKKAEKHERAEGVRDALKAGRGDILAGAKKLKMKKEGLDQAESLVKTRRAKMTKGKR